MLDYIIADYLRIIKRIPRIIGIALFYIALIIYMLVKSSSKTATWNSVSFVSAITTFTALFSLFLGVFEFLAIFSDDFKAKTMQVAIGLGIHRSKIIASKMIEVAILLLTDILLLALLLLLLIPITGVSLSGSQFIAVAVSLLSAWLEGVGYLSIVMPIVFYTYSMIAAILVYLPLVGSVVYNLLRYLTISGPEFIQKLHLEKLTLDSSLTVLTSHLLMGRLNFGALLGFVVYIALGYFLSLLLFRSKELEF